MTPKLAKSAFLYKDVLTPEEFVEAKLSGNIYSQEKNESGRCSSTSRVTTQAYGMIANCRMTMGTRLVISVVAHERIFYLGRIFSVLLFV